MSKICGQCKKVKSKSEFWKNKNTYDQLNYRCKDCQKLANRGYCLMKSEKMKDFTKWDKEKLKESVSKIIQSNKDLNDRIKRNNIIKEAYKKELKRR